MYLQVAGVHADGDAKKNLYFNELLPERFGRVRGNMLLVRLPVKLTFVKFTEALGIQLDDKSMQKSNQAYY